METYTRSEQFISIPQGTKILNGDTGNHQDFPPTRRVGDLNRFQGCLLPHTYTGTVQEISTISCPGQNIPVQSIAFQTIHSPHGVHCGSKRGETDGHAQGYKDPPVPKNVSTTGLAGKFREIRTGAQTSLPFCWRPVRPQVWSGLTHTGPVAEPSRKSNDNAIPSGLSSPAILVLDRFANSHRKAGSPWPTAYETHKVASQKQLEGTGISRKSDPYSQITSTPPAMVAEGRQRSSRLTITPNKICSANLYRHIIKQTHCKRNLVPSRKQAADKLSGTKSSLSILKRV